MGAPSMALRDDDTKQAGQVVAGRFELEMLLGKGGMGAVYRARDIATGRTLALKRLLVPAGGGGGGGEVLGVKATSTQ